MATSKKGGSSSKGKGSPSTIKKLKGVYKDESKPFGIGGLLIPPPTITKK